MDQIISKPTHPSFIDLEGKVFGRLKVISYAGRHPGPGYEKLWNCVCECGTCKPKVFGSALRSGGTVSCGCYRNERIREANTTHGVSYTPAHSAYFHAKERCESPKHHGYEYYGGRGIEFRFNSFEEFFKEIGPRPSPVHSLERKDNNGHYEVGNIKWATKLEQQRNRRTYKNSRLK